jgi:hypothetical protein
LAEPAIFLAVTDATPQSFVGRSRLFFFASGFRRRSFFCSRFLYSGFLSPLYFRYFYYFDGDRVTVSLPAFGEPLAHRVSEALRVNAQAGLEAAVRDGERVVKLGRAGKISHAKGVEPFERHGATFGGDHNFGL